MKKHLLSLLLLLCMVLGLTVPVFAAASVSMVVDNSIILAVNSPLTYVHGRQGNIDPDNSAVTPVVVENRTLVPVRFIAESLGAEVDWDGKSMTAIVTLGTDVIRVAINSSIMYLNDTVINLDVPARAENGRTLVPLRAVSEALDKEVFYYNSIILISDKPLGLDSGNPNDQKLVNEIRETKFPPADNAWLEAYATLLRGRYYDEPNFFLAYIDGDTVPELVLCSESPTNSLVSIYTYYDGKLTGVLDYMGNGSLAYAPGKNIIEVSSWSKPGDVYPFSLYTTFYEIYGGKSNKLTSFIVDVASDIYIMNGSSISASEYQNALNFLHYGRTFKTVRFSDGYAANESNIREMLENPSGVTVG